MEENAEWNVWQPALEEFNIAKSVFDDWKCINPRCNSTNPDDLEEGPAYWTCRNCGACQKGVGGVMVLDNAADVAFKESGPSSYSTFIPTKKDKDGAVIRGKVSYGCGVRRRYKREFYYRERIAQWTCTEPVLKESVKRRFDELVESGRYGSRHCLTRGDVMRMCKENKMCKYKENWKSVLNYLRRSRPNRLYDLERPNSFVLDYCQVMFKKISKRFDDLDKRHVSRFLRGSKGKLRHHILHVNYIHRKILEALGLWQFHREFPMLRTPSKIHALDDVMKMICENLGMDFTRSVVVQAPKCKSRNKKFFL